MTVTEDAIETDLYIEEILRQMQVDSLRRLVERLRKDLDEVKKDRDAWRSRAAEAETA